MGSAEEICDGSVDVVWIDEAGGTENVGLRYAEANGPRFRWRYTGGRSKRAPLREKTEPGIMFAGGVPAGRAGPSQY